PASVPRRGFCVSAEAIEPRLLLCTWGPPAGGAMPASVTSPDWSTTSKRLLVMVAYFSDQARFDSPTGSPNPLLPKSPDPSVERQDLTTVDSFLYDNSS